MAYIAILESLFTTVEPWQKIGQWWLLDSIRLWFFTQLNIPRIVCLHNSYTQKVRESPSMKGRLGKFGFYSHCLPLPIGGLIEGPIRARMEKRQRALAPNNSPKCKVLWKVVASHLNENILGKRQKMKKLKNLQKRK